MEALFTTFVAALLAEFGDKTQLLVIVLAARYRRPFPVLLGVACAALANNLLAAFAGSLIHGLITLRATSLLVAVALLFAGVAGLVRQKEERAMGEGWKTGAFLTTLICFFLLEFGEKTQFLTAALAAQYNTVVFAAAGATAGVLIANVPAVLLGEQMREALPLRRIKLGVAILFLLLGFVVAISALRLA